MRVEFARRGEAPAIAIWSSTAAGFSTCSVVIGMARGALRQDPSRSGFGILVPVNGTDASRHAAEFAFALARMVNSTVTVVYVSPKPGVVGAGARLGRSLLSRRHEDAILKDIAGLADQYGTSVRSVIRVADAPHNAILRQARRTGQTLIVLGVTKRPSDTLVFGTLANALLEQAETSVIFLAS